MPGLQGDERTRRHRVRRTTSQIVVAALSCDLYIEYTRAVDCRQRLRYEHKHAHTDVLLGIPDAIAWSWAKGGPWRQLIAPTVINVRDI